MAILLNPQFTLGWQRTGTLARLPIDGGAPREVLQMYRMLIGVRMEKTWQCTHYTKWIHTGISDWESSL